MRLPWLCLRHILCAWRLRHLFRALDPLRLLALVCLRWVPALVQLCGLILLWLGLLPMLCLCWRLLELNDPISGQQLIRRQSGLL